MIIEPDATAWHLPPPTKRERFLQLQISFADRQRAEQRGHKSRAETALFNRTIKLTSDEKKFLRTIIAEATQRIEELDSQIDLLESQRNAEFHKRRKISNRKQIELCELDSSKDNKFVIPENIKEAKS